MSRHTHVIVVVALFLMGLPFQLHGRQGLTPIELFPLEPSLTAQSFAVEISNGGLVAGTSRSAAGINTAVVWDRRGNATALAPRGNDLESFGEGINNSGQVVGHSRAGTGECAAGDTAVVWDRRGVTALPPLPGDVESRAFAISDTGVVVGISLGPRNPFPDCAALFTPVTWDRYGMVIELPRLLCEGTPDPADLLPEGLAMDVNNHGRAVGLHLDFVGQGCFPFVTGTSWDANGVEMAMMPPAGYFDTSANSVNNNGLVAGETFDFGFFGQPDLAVLWNRDGHATTLPPLGGDLESTGQAINDRGEVAGSSGAGLFGLATGTAVVWDQHGVPTALAPLPFDTDSFGFGINDAGHVVGHSRGADGVSRAVVWR